MADYLMGPNFTGWVYQVYFFNPITEEQAVYSGGPNIDPQFGNAQQECLSTVGTLTSTGGEYEGWTAAYVNFIPITLIALTEV